MTLGVNIQWGYAGIVNFGMMGFAALGGVAAVVAMPPVTAAGKLAGWGLWAACWRRQSPLFWACRHGSGWQPVAQTLLDNCADCGRVHRIAPAD